METYFILLFGLLLVIGGLLAVLYAVKRKLTWKHTDATVTSVKERRRGSESETTTWLYFRFTDEAGQEHRGSATPLSFRTVKRKNTIRIKYDPESPSEFNDSALPGEFFFSLVIVAILLLVGVLMVLHGFEELFV